MSSSRLPGKALAELAGEPMIQRVYERLLASRRIDEVLVLTSDEASDDPLCAELEVRGIPYRRGSLDDVLSRFEALLDEFDPTYVVRVTGDAPLVDPVFIDDQLAALERFDGDLTWCQPAGAFDGVLGGQTVVSARALRLAAHSENPLDREHVGSFFLRSHLSDLRVVEMRPDERYQDRGLRLCVDEESDLRLVRLLFETFDEEYGSDVPLDVVLDWLRARPELVGINADVQESADNRRLRALPPPQIRRVGSWSAKRLPDVA